MVLGIRRFADKYDNQATAIMIKYCRRVIRNSLEFFWKKSMKPMISEKNNVEHDGRRPKWESFHLMKMENSDGRSEKVPAEK